MRLGRLEYVNVLIMDPPMSSALVSKFSAEYMAVQVAGSCRMEGIHVSKAQEQRMCDIISGRLDAGLIAKQLANKYRSTPRNI